jgi:hypothetical protein
MQIPQVRSAPGGSLALPVLAVMAIQVIGLVVCLAVLKGLPDSFWMRPRPDKQAHEAWLWIPALLALLPASFAIWNAWHGRLRARHVAAHLFCAYLAFSLGRWSAIDLRAVLLAGTGLLALLPGLLVAQQWKETVSASLSRALQIWCVLLAAGLTILFTVAISEARAQTMGIALVMFATLNPVVQGGVAAICSGLPRWLNGRVRLGVILWLLLGAGVLWAAYPFVKNDLQSPIRQLVYNMALTASVGGLALILGDRADQAPWWRRALLPALLTVGGFLILQERGSLAVLFTTAIILVTLDRGRSREPLIMMSSVVLLGAILVICVPTVRDRWLHFVGASPLPELDTARSVLTLCGTLGWAGAARPGTIAAWAGRDYAMLATCLNGGILLGVLTFLSLIVFLFHTSEALLQVSNYSLRLLGIALCILWLTGIVVSLGWLGGMPFTGIPLAGLARGIVAIASINLGLTVLSGVIVGCRQGES